MHILSHPTTALHGQAEVPGDKSITQRAIILASLAKGQSRLAPFTPAADSLSTLHACAQLGMRYEIHEHELIIQGGTLTGSDGPLNLGNSGTGCRLLAGVLAGQAFDSILDGDDSLRQRPMRRIIEPLHAMGASITHQKLPLHIQGKELNGVTHHVQLASAQVKSCILLAGLFARGQTVVKQVPTRDHLERLLQYLQYPIHIENDTITLQGQAPIRSAQYQIPGDFSAAAFFMVAATMAPRAHIVISRVGINPRRLGLLKVLQSMGADIRLNQHTMFGLEPVADIEIRSAKTTGIEVPRDLIVDLVDEIPILAVLAACSQGLTTIRGAAELRVKESDRIHAMVQGLRALGVEVTEFEDGLMIQGGHIDGGEVDSLADHRIAMAFAIAGIRAKKPILIRNCDNVAISFPDFIAQAKHIGLRLDSLKEVL